jgi:hypothetical protein
VISSKIESGTMNGDVAETDENAGEPTGKRRVDVMGELAGPACQEHDERHDQFGSDGTQELRLLLQRPACAATARL